MDEKQIIDDLKIKLLSCKHQWVITDPYPEMTSYQIQEEIRSQLSFMDRLLLFRLPKRLEPDISIHKAWMDGYEFAWKLIEERIKKLLSEN